MSNLRDAAQTAADAMTVLATETDNLSLLVQGLTDVNVTLEFDELKRKIERIQAHLDNALEAESAKSAESGAGE